ncbi:MAG: hypothetical protein AB7T63_08455 [Planctomycetota bacterium]
MPERHEGRFVEIRRVPTAFEGELLVGRLVSEGIDARLDTRDSLQDEWAAVQRVMGEGLIRVFVPEADRARAEEILATPASIPDDLDEENPDEDDGTPSVG